MKAKSTPLPSSHSCMKISLPLTKVELRDHKRTKEGLITRRTKAKSIGYTPRGEAIGYTSQITARTRSKFPIIISCVKHLTEIQAFSCCGIFRECGDFPKIQKAYDTIQTTDQRDEDERIFKEIGIFGTADLLKTIINRLNGPLINEQCFQRLKIVTTLRTHTPEEYQTPNDNMFLRHLYIHAVLNLLPQKLLQVLREIFSFLVKVIQNRNETKMDSKNIATIFAPLLLPCGMNGMDISLFMQDNKSKIEFMCYLLDRFVEEPKILEKRFSKGSFEDVEFPRSGSISEQGPLILRGDLFTVFHRTKSVICGILGETAYLIRIDEFNKLIEPPEIIEKPKSPSLISRIYHTPRITISLHGMSPFQSRKVRESC